VSKVVVSSFITVGGVMEAPEQWSFPFWNDTIEQFKNHELDSTDAQLLGRKTYDVFAQAWPSRTGSYADRLNASPKYVVSRTLQHAGWSNSHILSGVSALVAALPTLKARHRGGLLLHGSQSLVQALVQRDLVDQFHLLVYPIVLGTGRRLFADGAATKLSLTKTQDMGSGVVLMVYERNREELEKVVAS